MSPALATALRDGLDTAAEITVLTPPRGATPGAVLVGHETDGEPLWSVWIEGPTGFYRTSVGGRDACALVKLLSSAAGHA